MIRLLLALLLSLAMPRGSDAQTAGDAPSSWSGTVELPGGTKLDFVVELNKDSGTISIPMQGAKDLPLSGVVVTATELKFAIEAAGAAWEMKVAADGKTAEGVLKQGGEFKTTMKRLVAGEAPKKSLNRPQEPKPPFAYESIEAYFENKAAGVTLAGTLTLPKGNGPFPCVVMVTGSGPQNRDEELLGHKPFLVIADQLTRHGVAVLRYDDRGIGKSTGKFTEATSDDFAADALAGVEYLKSRKEISAKNIGIIGHSEGGIIAPMCASQSKDVAFIVLLAGTGISGAELLPIQSKLINIADGMTSDDAQVQCQEEAAMLKLITTGRSQADVTKAIREAVIRQLRLDPETKGLSEEKLNERATQVATEQYTELSSPWFRRFLTLDPRDYLKKVTCPVLAINGEKDRQVPPKQNLPEIDKALKAGGNEDVTTVELPNLNHLFQNCKTGSPSEYADIEETFTPAALELVTTWIRKHSGFER